MGIVVKGQGVWFYILKGPPALHSPVSEGGEGGGRVTIIAYFSPTVPCQFVDGFHGRITVGAGK